MHTLYLSHNPFGLNDLVRKEKVGLEFFTQSLNPKKWLGEKCKNDTFFFYKYQHPQKEKKQVERLTNHNMPTTYIEIRDFLTSIHTHTHRCPQQHTLKLGFLIETLTNFFLLFFSVSLAGHSNFQSLFRLDTYHSVKQHWKSTPPFNIHKKLNGCSKIRFMLF